MSGKKDRKSRQDLTALEDRYQIVGELSAREYLHEYLATRRDGGTDVLILVEDPPPGDAGNALTLFAADVNLLASLEHRNLIPIHEGSWLGQDRFAVVTERCQHPTIETLIGRGEHWSYPRIATILHQLNGLLDWARQQKVVHRAITLDTVHLEPDTDRLLASFVAQPLTRQGPPGPEGDARTVASLAWSLITRGRDLPRTPEDSLGVVRPELPRMVVEATDALLHGHRIGETEPPAVLDYIALVAMTEAIMRGEIEAARMQATLEQERKLEREDWLAKEEDYRERIEELERSIAAEREEMARTLETERETLASTLETERAQMASTVADLERRTEEEKEEMRRAIADERVEMQETLEREREELATLRADLERAIAEERGELEQDRARHEEEVAAERAAMAATIAEERAAMERTIVDERARLEQILADERARLDAEREEGDARLAAERAEFAEAMTAQREEFEAAAKAQREEFDARLAAERDEFDRIILEERTALEAEKEGFAVFNAAEREAIEAERRALEELYLAYEAEGRVVELEADAAAERTDDTERATPRAIPPFADLAPLAVAQPVIEPVADSGEPEETESGLTRSAAARARRAAGSITASVLLLVSIISAAAVGVGSNRRAAAERSTPADAAIAADLQRAAQPTRAAAPANPAVIDSAAGTIAPPDSLSAVPQGRAQRPEAPAPAGTGAPAYP